jgi:murein DD-endopeptidase MepM/ murein hydrolase activator NlpD
MLVPHSQKHVIRFRINYFVVAYVIAILITLGGFAVYSMVQQRSYSTLKSLESNKLNAWENTLWLIQNKEAALRNSIHAYKVQGNEYYHEIWGDVYHQDLSGSSFISLVNMHKELEDALQPMNLVLDMLLLREKNFISLPLGWPVTSAAITSEYGMRISPFGSSKDFHSGVDFANMIGTPIKATADGIVTYAARSTSGYGLYVKIKHDHGFMTLYGHASAILVKEDEYVKRGDVVALLGRSGAATGPHVHYEVRLLNSDPIASFYELYLNPLPFIQENP